MKYKKLIFIFSSICLVIIWWYTAYSYLFKQEEPIKKPVVNNNTNNETSWNNKKVKPTNTKPTNSIKTEEEIDLLNKRNFWKEKKENTLLTLNNEIEKKENFEKKWDSFHIFFINNWNSKQNEIISEYNNYISNIMRNSLTNFKFYTTKIDSKGKCISDIKIIKKDSVNVFDKLPYSFNLLDLFQFINSLEWKNSVLFIINWIDLSYNCNNLKEIEEYMKIERKWKAFNNVIFLKEKDRKYDNIQKKYYDDLANITWVRLEEYTDIYQYNNLLERNIYTFNRFQNGWWTSEKWWVNTKIFLLNEKDVWTTAEISIMKKEGNNFKLLQKTTSTSAYYWSLNPWIYYFIWYDPINKIYLETKPQTINNNSPFSHTFNFKQTKVQLSLFDKDKKPILWNFYVEYSSINEKWNKSYNWQSQVLLYWKPWEYKVKVDLINKNDSFQSSFKLEWEDSFIKEFITKEVPLSVSVLDRKSNTAKDNVVVSISKNNSVIFQKNGWNFTTNLTVWEYNVAVKDIESWIVVNRKINVSDSSSLQSVKVYFESHDVLLDLWLEPIIVELYSINDISWNSLKSISWSWVRNISLPEWEYIVKVFDLNKENERTVNFSVSSFYENTVKLWK